MKHTTPLRAAFSIIELLIVIVILGGLVAVVAPGLMDSADQAKRDTVCLKMNDLGKRLDMFKLDNGMYPDTEEGFEALTANPDEEKYPNYRAKPYLKSSLKIRGKVHLSTLRKEMNLKSSLLPLIEKRVEKRMPKIFSFLTVTNNT